MKNILVLTDFSENAAHAAELSVLLCAKLHTDLLLYNTFLDAIVIPNYTGRVLSVDKIIELEDEYKDKLNKLAIRLNTLIDGMHPDGYRPKVQYLLGEGSLGNNIEELAHKHDVELIVMGGHSEKTLEHLLLGSDTYAVIQHTSKPVLVVPAESDTKKIQTIVFATDFQEADIKAIQYLAKLGELFGAQLEVVHVVPEDKKADFTSPQQKTFTEQMAQLNYPRMTIKGVYGDEVIEQINNRCKETQTDLLALTHYQRSLFTRLLKRSTTKEALSNQQIPVLIFPMQMNNP